MTSIDANLLLYSYDDDSPHCQVARPFIQALSIREDVVLSEFVLCEFYILLRNPAVLVRPLKAQEAVDVIQRYRRHPCWGIVGFPPPNREIHDELWRRAADPDFARRRLFDLRTALSLRAFGVTEFATANKKDFQGLGFRRVWNPLEL